MAGTYARHAKFRTSKKGLARLPAHPGYKDKARADWPPVGSAVDRQPGPCLNPAVARSSEHAQGTKPARRVQHALVAQLEAQLARERQASSALRDVALAMAQPVELDRVLELILQRSAELLNAERATLYLLEAESGELVSRLVVGGRVQTIRVPVGKGIAGAVVELGRALRVADAYQDPRFSREWDAVTGYRTRAILAVPMRAHTGDITGVLQVLNKRDGGAFSADDEVLLESLATQAAIAIDNVKLVLSLVHKNKELRAARRRLERKVSDLKLLFDLESSTARATSESELVGALLRQTLEPMHARRGFVLLERASQGYLLYTVGTEPAGELHESKLDSAPEWLAAKMRGLTVEHVPVPVGHGELFGCCKECSAIVSPLLGEDRAPVGVIGWLDCAQGRDFLEDDLELVQLIAANASTAISLQRSREARQTSERLSTIGRLVSGVLHDLKTPMTVINGYAQLLAATDDAKQRQEYAELIFKQFEHITGMQREVLAFARGERTLLMSRVYLTPFFQELRTQIERELEGRPIKLELNVEDRAVARFDQAKITRALHNLVRNAIDAMADGGGVLRMEVRQQPDTLTITVSDTGPGIPKEVEGKLFESFVTARKEGGTGLGLAIVKKIVDEHGGSIEVRSSKAGAQFTIRLPQAAASAG